MNKHWIHCVWYKAIFIKMKLNESAFIWNVWNFLKSHSSILSWRSRCIMVIYMKQTSKILTKSQTLLLSKSILRWVHSSMGFLKWEYQCMLMTVKTDSKLPDWHSIWQMLGLTWNKNWVKLFWFCCQFEPDHCSHMRIS